MATAQDVEHRKMSSNSDSPPQPGSLSTADLRKRRYSLKSHPLTVLESPNRKEAYPSLRVEVTFLRARVPRIKKQLGLKRRFFVTLTNYATMKKTKSVHIDGEWTDEVPVVISDGDGEAGKSTIIYLAITVSSDATSPMVSSSPEELTKGDNSTDEEPTNAHSRPGGDVARRGSDCSLSRR
ncbi:hypothetical protein EDB83DRAFT_2315298 [Lactarius deliciosus]|nr:hypothetical protein EDB83DRAFT_2315298 [Lactarius deliciosus]